jgi:hypothetical protein
MKNCLRHPIREHLLSKAVLAFDLLLWLCWLPVILRILNVPRLLKKISQQPKFKSEPKMGLPTAVGIVTRVCRLRVFRLRIFPKACLRQSLMLFRTLTRMGYPVEIHFGVAKHEANLRGHSWTTLEGRRVADTASSDSFKVLYSYSSVELHPVVRDDGQVKPSEILGVLNRV